MRSSLEFTEIGTFQVAHGHLGWPWIAIDPTHRRFAFPAAKHKMESRLLSADLLEVGPGIPLPMDLGLPTSKAPPTGHRGVDAGIQGFALHPAGTRLAVTGRVEGASVLSTLTTEGELVRSRVEALAGGDFTAHAVSFDRSGRWLWVSAESGQETALLLLEAETHAVRGVLTSPPFPPPAFHELHVHPQDDAVLLLAACGQDGTFARVAGFTDGPPVAIESPLDGGGQPCGLMGFSADGARVHLVEDEQLRTHSWPGLLELSAVPFPDDFVSTYGGVVFGGRLLVDGQDADSGDGDAVMLFDRSATRGAMVTPNVPTGMWAGRLGPDGLITIASKGDPATGRVYRFPEPKN